MGQPLRRHSSTARFDGIAVSPGVAIARAHCLHEIPVGSVTDPIDESEVLAELGRFEEALQLTDHELAALRDKVSVQLGKSEAAIFTAHLAILRDEGLLEKVQRRIGQQRLPAAAAIAEVAYEYQQLLADVHDEYLKERVADVRDVLLRLQRNVAKITHHDFAAHDEPIVLVACELYPSDIIALTEANVVGIVTQTGSRTGHAAILARSYGLPAVAGVTDILQHVNSSDTIVVDGSGGHVFVNPGRETLRAYRERRSEFARLKTDLAAEPRGPAHTADGQTIALLANVNCETDIREAIAGGACGVGLYRTEFFFLTHPNVPDQQQQTENYRQMIAHCPGDIFTIRTLDLGGDKTISYLTHTHEHNPHIGWRSIRLSFAHPKFFLTQLRAVLAAAANQDKEVRLLFPMITVPDELDEVHKLMRRARRQLKKRGQPCGKVRIGMMIEVPAAAVALDAFLENVDFVSIGSNDLVQYLTAADRDNPKVSHLCQALCPAVLRVVASVAATCHRTRTPVTLCGEMASSPRAVPLLLGMGLRNLSMSTAFIPTIRDLIGRLTIPETQAVLAEVMKLKTARQVCETMDRYLAARAPHLLPLVLA
ncbi:MAG: phosphoenolpyruvate--protein phosphotransferase [Planctomycetales bacterium]|nr:phosphoenolpyruvate--protein phosphotransferase [Planctomycetales bacterium]NIM08535.1 phosphoenolpyruvate--protein phosphotransferase [Planctomycetales bacterium]NIN08006.1 phosphoenolpyruvate--protein phosphotransferase [Planctomycetales bacterium]NIN77135.1 phosphoenolpyruvate--protein phosphotransferase [Planctomycetales bacterium]NIO34319.1 phosphoenolpyruvate--protein phosphotransferase [Planctomycetales bacterium]